MKRQFKIGVFLLALVLGTIVTPVEAGFGSIMGRGFFKGSGSGYSGGYNSYSYEEERRQQEAERKEREIRSARETRMQMVFGGMVLVGAGWVYYARSRRRQSEAVQNVQAYTAPVVEPKAQILSYDPGTQTGKITTPQGKRYEFRGEDVASGFSELQFGVKVDFDLSESQTPINIRPAQFDTSKLPLENASALAKDISPAKPNIMIAPWFMTLLYTPIFALFLLLLLDGTYIFGRYVNTDHVPFWLETLSFVYLFAIMKFTPVTFAYEKVESLQKNGTNVYQIYSRVLYTLLYIVPISWVLSTLAYGMTRNYVIAFFIVPAIAGVVLFTLKGFAVQVMEKANSNSIQKPTVLKRWITGVLIFPSIALLLVKFMEERTHSGLLVLLILAVIMTLILKFNPASMTVTAVNDRSSNENS